MASINPHHVMHGGLPLVLAKGKITERKAAAALRDIGVLFHVGKNEAGKSVYTVNYVDGDETTEWAGTDLFGAVMQGYILQIKRGMFGITPLPF